jgi:hypothetical protein
MEEATAGLLRDKSVEAADAREAGVTSRIMRRRPVSNPTSAGPPVLVERNDSLFIVELSFVKVYEQIFSPTQTFQKMMRGRALITKQPCSG